MPPPETLATIKKKYTFEVKLRSQLPAFARWWLIRFVAGRSALLRAALAEGLDRATRSDAPPFMSGIATYL